MTNQTCILNFLLSLMLISLSGPASAWGGKGHQTVAAIAEILLEGTAAESGIQNILLEDESLISISVWADCVKHPQTGYCNDDSDAHKQEWSGFLNKVGKDNSTHYHFADVDINSAGYSFDQNPQQEDVVRGIREAIGKLSGDPAVSNPHNLDRREALWLLVHLLGDIHQPLHIGVIAIGGDIKATLGGNWLYPSPTSCLHAKWDDDYVAAAMKRSRTDSSEEYAEYILEKHRNSDLANTTGSIIDWPQAWANETLAVARDKAFYSVNVGDAMNGACGYNCAMPAGLSNCLLVMQNQRWQQPKISFGKQACA